MCRYIQVCKMENSVSQWPHVVVCKWGGVCVCVCVCVCGGGGLERRRGKGGWVGGGVCCVCVVGRWLGRRCGESLGVCVACGWGGGLERGGGEVGGVCVCVCVCVCV